MSHIAMPDGKASSGDWTSTRFRSSLSFTTVAISFAVFTDNYLYGAIIPILPVILVQRVGIEEHNLQKWISAFLAIFGAATIVGSRTFDVSLLSLAILVH